MKRNVLAFIFIVMSIIWLSFFIVYFIGYINNSNVTSSIRESEKNLENLNFYKKNSEALEMEYESISLQTFSSKSTSEFIAQLPKLGEFSGIGEMQIENTDVKKEKDYEITELKITVNSSFPNIANFIDILERSKLPIRVASLRMAFDKKKLYTEMSIKIYKKVIED